MGDTPERPSGVMDDAAREALPSGHAFADADKRMLAVLRRSYRMKTAENDKLWEAFGADGRPSQITFVEAMDKMEERKLVSMVQEVYTRLDRTKVDIFDHIFVITNLYRSDSSWGFLCAMTDVPIAREKLMKSPQFCRDLPAGEATHQRSERNQERACFREFSGIGHPGLHVCLVKDGQQNERGGYHNVHIDPHQIAKEKTKRCSCWYAGIQNHFKDVGDYIIRSFVVKKVLKGVTARMPKELEQTIEDSLTKALLTALLSVSGDFDKLEAKFSDPNAALPASVDLVPGLRKALVAELRGLKQWYMENV